MSRTTSVNRSFGRARWAIARRASLPHAIPRWTLLSAALSYENRVDAGRPDVDASVQLAAELALSKRRKFRYNPE